MKMIVDAHTHLLPDRLAAAIRRFFADRGLDDFSYPTDHRTVLDRHHADGIDTIWNLPYAHKAGMARALNEAMLEASAAVADHPVTVLPGCTVHPDDADPVADFDAAIDAGAKILKLHCSVGDYEADDPRLAPVLASAGQRHVPVVIHAGHSPTGFTMENEIAPIGRAAAANPGTTIILAHFGHEAFLQAVTLLDEQPNVVADLTPVTGSPVPLTVEIAERLGDRIIFGSDAPNTRMAAGELLAGLRTLGISDSTLDKILSTNARALTA